MQELGHIGRGQTTKDLELLEVADMEFVVLAKCDGVYCIVQKGEELYFSVHELRDICMFFFLLLGCAIQGDTNTTQRKTQRKEEEQTECERRGLIGQNEVDRMQTTQMWWQTIRRSDSKAEGRHRKRKEERKERWKVDRDTVCVCVWYGPHFSFPYRPCVAMQSGCLVYRACPMHLYRLAVVCGHVWCVRIVSVDIAPGCTCCVGHIPHR